MVRPKKLPAEAVPSEQYGQKAQHLVEQKQVPMADGEVSQGAPGPPPGPPGPGGEQAAGPGGLVPGEMGEMGRETERPDEAVTAGLQSGAGGGPEMLQAPDPRVKVAAILNALGDDADPETAHIRQILNASLANQDAP